MSTSLETDRLRQIVAACEQELSDAGLGNPEIQPTLDRLAAAKQQLQSRSCVNH